MIINELLDISENIRISLTGGVCHHIDVLVSNSIVRYCWLGVEHEWDSEQTLGTSAIPLGIGRNASALRTHLDPFNLEVLARCKRFLVAK